MTQTRPHQPLTTRRQTATPLVANTPPCVDDPDRWTSDYDDPELKSLCRLACPRRWQCAKDALQTPGANGVWAGVFIPERGRSRKLAMRQLREVTVHGNFRGSQAQ